MAKNIITVKFRLFSVFSVLLATVVSRIFQILYLWAYSDITVSDVFTHVFNYSSKVFSIFAVVLAVCCTVYAHSYFGKKTAISTSFISFGCLAAGKILMFIYNIAANQVSAAQMISGAFTYTIEALFDALVIVMAMIFSLTFAKKRSSSKKDNAESFYSPDKASGSTFFAYVFILIADLTLMNVIPFLISAESIIAEDVKTILTDYLYYLAYLPVGIILILITMALIRKTTGKLMLKTHFIQQKEHKDELKA